MSILPLTTPTKLYPNTLTFPKQASFLKTANHIAFASSAANVSQNLEAVTERRSANYMPNIWEHEFVTSLKSEYTGEVHVRRADSLRAKVKHLLDHMLELEGPLALLELIDDIQRLGLGYMFEVDIQRNLSSCEENSVLMDQSLHTMSLYFRLSRQHGFNVTEDVFKVFKEDDGSFIDDISKDIRGVLSLYEASYFGIEGEDTLDEAKKFAHIHLTNTKEKMDSNLVEQVDHALDLPLNLRMIRLETRWYLDAYSRRKDVIPYLLELAKLDFNMVQATHQVDVIAMSRWWKDLGLPDKLPFARDRLVECFLWSVGVAYEPQYDNCREGVTKLCILLTIIDDIYDVYATYEEAKLFTDAVVRWDLNAVEQLPEYMKISFLALYNTVNGIAYDTLKKHGVNIIPFLRKMWADQCKSFLLEATWFHTGYKPTLQEYLETSCISLGGPLVLFHTYFFMSSEITSEALQYLASYPDLIRCSSMILRLTDDMGTSKAELERGDNLKSIQCYMHEKGVTEEVGRKYIRYFTDEMWKKMNAEVLIDSPLPCEFVKLVVNWARTAETTYQYDDGHGVPDKETKTRILSLLVDSVPML
ncbi:hypothetical protein ACHQM5_016206 [Ranunculus cassubicifolius]